MWRYTVACLCVCLPLGFASAVSNEDLDSKQFFAHPKDIRGNGTISPRIIGGQEVTAHTYPSQVGLFLYVGSDVFFCGGSLITNQWVLTAAHCLSMKPDYILVVLGAHDLINLEYPVVVLKSTKYKYHSGWDEDTFQNDVGLVRLPWDVTFNQYIKPAKLVNGSSTYVGDTGTIVGWGATASEGDISTVLRSVRSTVMSNTACSSAHPQYNQLIKPMHLCTLGTGPVGSCNGDSGGPVFVNGAQVGIVSFGPTNCTAGLPSVFTRVTIFHDWIIEHAKDGATSFDKVKLAAIVLVTLSLSKIFQ